MVWTRLLRQGILLLALSVAAALSGCVERRLTIQTQPPGATVLLNDEEIGASPVTVSFNWYGDYRVQCIKPGYAVLTTHRELKAPVHDTFPLDFFYGVLWPGRILDEFEWTFELSAYQPPDREALIDQAQQRKGQALRDLKAPLPGEASNP
ncbi:MAG: PEGA domain-containing protein [Sedimentisphaerales bacterium]|nr:PEGA domain-containing protein [Sedimentisphaerales bacterium]